MIGSFVHREAEALAAARADRPTRGYPNEETGPASNARSGSSTERTVASADATCARR